MKAKCNGIATVLIVIVVMVVAIGMGACASIFNPPDREMEEALEAVVNSTLDGQLHVPEGTFDVDFTPGSEE